MTRRLLGIGTAVTAVVLTAGVAVAQRADDEQAQRPRGQVVAPATPQRPAGAPQMGVGRGRGGPGQMGPGQMGPGQGRGAGRGVGPGQGMGPGRGMGPGGGRGQLGPGRGMGPGGGRGLLGARLDLTDDQQSAIETLHRGARDQAAAVTDELELTRHALHREVFADKRDAAKITALSTKLAALEKQLSDVHLKTQVGVADVLTPAQRETMRLAGGGPGRGR